MNQAQAVIQLDADAARYLAKVARMADATKKVTKEADKTGRRMGVWTKELGRAVPLVSQLTSGAGALGSAMGAVLAVMQGLNREIRAAAQTSQQLGTDLAKVVGNSVGIGQFKNVQEGIKGFAGRGRLNTQQLTGAFSAAAGAAPTASTDQLLSITGAAQTASLGFIDENLFAQTAGSLVNAGVDPSVASELAGQIVQASGQDASQAAAITRQLIGQVGGDQAVEVAQAVIGFAQSGQGFEPLRAAVSRYRGGNLGEFLQRRSLSNQLGVEQRGKFIAGARATAGVQVQTSGFLAGQAALARQQDPTLARQIRTAEIQGATEVAREEALGGAISSFGVVRAGLDQEFAGEGGFTANALGRAAAGPIGAIDLLRRMLNVNEEIAENTRKGPSVGMDREGAP
jgi:hypothetical protein